MKYLKRTVKEIVTMLNGRVYFNISVVTTQPNPTKGTLLDGTPVEKINGKWKEAPHQTN